jgi:tRNA U38,U39,U40 pseudouridine synthase TruA
MATLKLTGVSAWENQYYFRTGKYGWLHDVREGLPQLRAASILDWVEVSRGVEVRTSADGKAYLAQASVPEYGVECAMYERKSTDILASNAEAPAESKIYDMRGWPDNLSAVECRRNRFPWPLLHMLGLGYLSSDEITSGLRSVGQRLSW